MSAIPAIPHEPLSRLLALASEFSGISPDRMGGRHLERDLGFDSLDAVSFVLEIERRERVKLAPSDLARCVTVDDLAGLVAAVRSARAGA